ncbi:carbon-nitrogen hydrolase family protein [Sphingobium fuliginis]|uniref:Predicted amidohydrolase n=1 Tax=Sphingobium fuliginis (strain ATCC 27551) TaxID=336203 RepID=A0A292ZDM2_SPHSA|nr:carbon-nitrogen hydrolase family protein [Sphingobium fuliginis]GAY22812.1 predicted amidohydrolase [Sphingobium fuliginis]
MRLATIQMNSVGDVAENLHTAYDLMLRAVEYEGVDWLLLPEHFHWAGGTIEDRHRAAEILGQGPAYAMCAEFAAKHKVIVHAGSIFERATDEPRIYNTTVAFDRNGAELARYRKIHLFDIDGPDGRSYRESDTVAPGNEVVTYDANGITVGCSICYDLRFPLLFQQLVAKGAQIIAIPAAFTLQTGKDHWEPLIRARAIETQTYVVASGSCGVVDYEGQAHWTYGHSMIVDPWGHVVAMCSDGRGYAVHVFEPDRVAKVRHDIPVSAYVARSRS